MNNPELSNLTTGFESHWLIAMGEPQIQRFLAGRDWEKVFSSEDLAVIREITEGMKRLYPWLCATPDQARSVILSASYPRSRLGARQSDWLTRVIYAVRDRCSDIKSAALEIVEIVTAPLPACPEEFGKSSVPEGSFFWLVYQLSKSPLLDRSFQPKTLSELLGAIANGSRYLENYEATAGDYAIEALQGSFVGLMRNTHAWGQKGRPTKGKVIAMAKEILHRDGKSKKSGWTDMLAKAGLDFLPEGKSGRPRKSELDEIIRAKQEVLADITKLTNETMGGNWLVLRDRMKSVFGGKKVALQSEQERLDAQYGQPRMPDEEH